MKGFGKMKRRRSGEREGQPECKGEANGSEMDCNDGAGQRVEEGEKSEPP